MIVRNMKQLISGYLWSLALVISLLLFSATIHIHVVGCLCLHRISPKWSTLSSHCRFSSTFLLQTNCRQWRDNIDTLYIHLFHFVLYWKRWWWDSRMTWLNYLETTNSKLEHLETLFFKPKFQQNKTIMNMGNFSKDAVNRSWVPSSTTTVRF